MLNDANRLFARFIGASIVSAMLAIGGVWFVVDQSLSSLRGHVASIDRRMDTLVTKELMAAEFRALRAELAAVRQERDDRRRASLTPIPPVE